MSNGDEHEAYVHQRRWDIVYRVRLSILYHLERESFFDRADKWITAITALAATAAVVQLTSTVDWLKNGLALGTAALSLVPLVWNPAERARHHGQLAAEFRRLLVDCEKSGARWSEELCDKFQARIVEIEAGEGALLCALVAHCQTQLAMMNPKEDDKRVYQPWWQRRLMHFISFDPLGIKQRSDQIRHKRKLRSAVE